jgi:hypothetical protein
MQSTHLGDPPQDLLRSAPTLPCSACGATPAASHACGRSSPNERCWCAARCVGTPVSTLECPWSTLTSLHTRAVPLRARARARPRAVRLRCRAPRGTADERRRNPTGIDICIYAYLYMCVCIYIQNKTPTYKIRAICTILHDTQHKHTAGTPARRCRHALHASAAAHRRWRRRTAAAWSSRRRPRAC